MDTSLHALPADLLQAVEASGFKTFTPIQAQCIPLLRQGLDLIGESQTGSGKTLAFALPLLEKIHTQGRVLQGLVLCPTRELCDQVVRTIRSMGRFKKDLLVTTVVGGQPAYHQIKALMNGAHIVVGTPGRLGDLLNRGKIDLSQVHTVVLDEADRMLDMGFREPIEYILGFTPAERQTALFSATFPPTIESLSRRYQRSPKRITVEIPLSEKPLIHQTAYCIPESARLTTLTRLLVENRCESALVFCNLKTSVDEVTAALKNVGLSVDKIHGDLEQIDRDRVMACFRNGSVRILVATDVAARGLDVSGLDAVVNFEIAKDPQTHVHRIGRTGRAGKSGNAFTLWSEREKPKIERIEAFMGMTLEQGKLKPVAHKNIARMPELETIEISGGRKAKLRPGDILGALTGEGCHLAGTAIGKIEIKDHKSYVAVDKAFARQAVKALQQGKIKGRRFLVSLVAPTQGQAHSEKNHARR